MSAAADFAERFAAYWQAPSVDGLDEILAPDVRLVAPMTPATHGLADGKKVMGALLQALPDITGVVHRWGETDDGLLIEFTLSATAGGKPLSWDAVDRFVLREDGLATERFNYFDSAVLVRTALLRLRTWPTFLRLRARV
ncbi:MAG TPA: nuclear transport factor 2 family protein [Solirubrobacterales bacterium]|nr:nuclear transport factor 2 family protein [Solirubrobacterales bacterium]